MKDDLWLSQKGIDYVLSPKRGAWTTINPEVCQALTAKGQENWIGTFISPSIDHIEREPIQGGKSPTIIYMKDGRVYSYDGEKYERKDR